MEPIQHNELGLDMTFDYQESIDLFLDGLNSAAFTNTTNNNLSTPAATDSTTFPQVPMTASHNAFFRTSPLPTPMNVQEGSIASTPPSYKSKLSRTQMKQELQRMKTVEDERRESEQRQRLQHGRLSMSAALPLLSTSTVVLTSNPDAPTTPTTPLPAQVLKVTNLLENPTPYHSRETQQRQVRQFLTNSAASSGSVPPLVGGSTTNEFFRSATQSRFQQLVNHHHAISAPATVELSSSHPPYDLVSSPGAYSSLVSSVTSLGSLAEVGTDIINTILDLEDQTSDLTEGLQTLNCTESRDSTAVSTSGRRQTSGPTSKFDEPSKLAKDRQRKDNHNQIERKRRFNINDRITELGKMLPKEGEAYHKEVGEFRYHKGNILKATVDYIKLLRNENDQLSSNQKELDLEMKRLLLQLKEYEELLAEHRISIPESRLTWRRLENVNGLQQFGSPTPVKVKHEPHCDLIQPETPNHSLVDIMEDELLLGGLDSLTGNDPMMSQAFLDHHRMDF